MKGINWLNIRKFVLVFLFIDISSLLLITFNSQREELNNLFIFSFSTLWIIFSYVLSRYSFRKPKINFFFFVNEFYKLLITFSLTLLILFVLNTFLSIFEFLLISNLFLIDFAIKQLLLSLIFFCSIKILFIKIKRIKKTYFFIGSKETFLKFKNICKQSFQDDLTEVKFFEKRGGILNADLIISDKEELDILLKDPFIYSIILEHKKNIFTLTDWIEIYLQRIPNEFIDFNKKYLTLTFYGISGLNHKIKRSIDIVVSLIIIFFSLPLIVIISLLIYLEDFGPVFYFQKRNGYQGKIINIPKFRSMRVDAEKTGVVWSQKNDPRVTRIGKFIRAFRIDELPQLFLVIIGEMSLIGPRPERPEIDEFLSKEIKYYSLRYRVLPGLSGWSQVCYRYGSSLEDSKIKLSYDFFYIKNYSLTLDLLIFFKTLKVILGAQK